MSKVQSPLTNFELLDRWIREIGRLKVNVQVSLPDFGLWTLDFGHWT